MALARRAVDVKLTDFNDTGTAGEEICHRLLTKGFCNIDLDLTPEDSENAVLEVKDWESNQKWGRVNSVIQEALLGSEGSARIAELEPLGLDVEMRSDAATLMRLDEEITALGLRLEGPLEERMGITISHRTLAIVHQSGERTNDQAPLTEREVMKWMSQFMRHRVMVIIFCGPTAGTLELKPYASDQTRKYEVPTWPGSCVLLRPDLMSHTHYSPGRSIALTSFFLTGTSNRRSIVDPLNAIPIVCQLDEWVQQRLRELKEAEQEGTAWDLDVPREWQHAMNHIYHKGQMIAVRGTCFKMPSSEVLEEFFQVSTGGVDYGADVPLSRWDHSQAYDPTPESWKFMKTDCKHASFIDGIDLFDCKMFSMTPNEAKSTDPHQRLIMEVGYQALYHMGMRKNTLVNASCGVYVGCGNTEWSQADKDADFGAFGATGGALSISSGRFSFTLGLKGASMTLDTEASSGSSAVYLAAESCQTRGNSQVHDLAIGIAAHILLAPVFWPSQSSSGWLSRQGRCFTFDESADGYIRADGVGACAMKPMAQMVDGEIVIGEEPVIGCLAGATMNNNGRGASLAAPHGPSEQEAIADALRNASISPYDVDSVEAHGHGNLLADAVEAGSLARAHRSEEMKDPIMVVNLKSSVGNQTETGGIAAFAKALYASQWGMMTPTLHLQVVNPHMDAFEKPLSFATECLAYRMGSCFHGVMSRGFGGSNVYLLAWGQVNTEKVEPITTASYTTEESLMFWPGGGGVLSEDQRPSQCYTVVGTWTKWEAAEPMLAEGDNAYGMTMTLGENRWEEFQIWLDGDPTRVLHPGAEKAAKDTACHGPDHEDVNHYNWIIDGRKEIEFADEYDMGSVEVYGRESPDLGVPGDQFRIRLKVVGKWRSVTWEKVPRPVRAAGDATPAFPSGSYSIVGSWNGFEPVPMTKGPRLGRHYLEVEITQFGGEFQIVRDNDWGQVLYPSISNCGADGVAKAKVLGPNSWGHGYNWHIACTPGERFLIEFNRTIDAEGDKREVCWSKRQYTEAASLEDSASPTAAPQVVPQLE